MKCFKTGIIQGISKAVTRIACQVHEMRLKCITSEPLNASFFRNFNSAVYEIQYIRTFMVHWNFEQNILAFVKGVIFEEILWGYFDF